MNKPLVSVCMITYMHEAFIAQAIEGVLMQEVDFEIELVIAEDASPDNSFLTIRDFINSHPKRHLIRYIRNSNNKGVNQNFIDAILLCKGKYIALCEGDDYWTDPLKLQKQVDFLEENAKYSMSFHNGTSVNENGKLLKESIVNISTRKDLNFEDLLSGYYTIPTLTVVFRNYLLKGFPDEYFKVVNCDTFLFILLSQYGDIHYHNNINGCIHIVNDQGIWSKKKELYKSISSYNTYFQIKNFLKDKRLSLSLLNFGNAVIAFSIKEKKIFLLAKFYLKTFFLSIQNKEYFKIFVKKHFSFIINKGK